MKRAQYKYLNIGELEGRKLPLELRMSRGK